MTIEGAPHIKDDHLAVFDCANKCGKFGKRFIAARAHLAMMAAAQPFISGAISKTVNVPQETTVEKIEDLYVEGWTLGLKAVAIYRDGSKLSQPLNSATSDDKADTADNKAEASISLPDLHHPIKRKLPQKRQGFTQEARVAGHKVFLRTGEYENGDLGEIFIDMHKEGAPFRSMLNCFAIAISKGLQYGVPLEEFVETFTFTRFEPWGSVDHPNIKFSTSVIDYIFRALGYEYLGRTDFLQIKPEDMEPDINDPNPQSHHGTSPSEASNASVQQEPPETPDDSAPEETSQTQQNNNNTLAHISKNGNGTTDHMPELHPTKAAVLDEQLSQMMGDAPFCDSCGHITVRNGSCYRCLNCGNSMGCS